MLYSQRDASGNRLRLFPEYKNIGGVRCSSCSLGLYGCEYNPGSLTGGKKERDSHDNWAEWLGQINTHENHFRAGGATKREGRYSLRIWTYRDWERIIIIVRKGRGYVPQERNVFSSLTVMETLEMGGFYSTGYALRVGTSKFGFTRDFIVFVIGIHSPCEFRTTCTPTIIGYAPYSSLVAP